MRRNTLQRYAFGCTLGLLATSAPAEVPYFNGFETPTSVNDFQSPSGVPGAGITRVASGGGTLGYTAAGGSFYAEIHNTDSFGGPGIGYAGLTNFGALTPASGGFTESLDVYIDTSRWLPPTTGSAFVMTARTQVTHDTFINAANILFNVSTPGTINITSVPAVQDTGPITFSNLATITTSGWYQIEFAFTPGSQFVQSDVSVLDAQGNLLGTAHGQSPGLASDLVGNGTLIFGPWRDGFAGDVLAIDNLQTFATPEPMALGLAPMMLLLHRRRSRR